MDKNEAARKLAKLGQREARLMAKLTALQKERCELLQCAARSEEAGLDADVVAFSVAPKEED